MSFFSSLFSLWYLHCGKSLEIDRIDNHSIAQTLGRFSLYEKGHRVGVLLYLSLRRLGISFSNRLIRLMPSSSLLFKILSNECAPCRASEPDHQTHSDSFITSSDFVLAVVMPVSAHEQQTFMALWCARVHKVSNEIVLFLIIIKFANKFMIMALLGAMRYYRLNKRITNTGCKPLNKG